MHFTLLYGLNDLSNKIQLWKVTIYLQWLKKDQLKVTGKKKVGFLCPVLLFHGIFEAGLKFFSFCLPRQPWVSFLQDQ